MSAAFLSRAVGSLRSRPMAGCGDATPMRAGLVGLCLLLLLPLVIGAQTHDVPRVTTEHGGFAFPDRSGTRLLLLLAPEWSDRLETALCSDGRRELVRFARRQDGGGGREDPSHFDELAGSVFDLPAARLDPDATCFLASDSVLAARTVITLSESTGSDACAQRDRLTALRNRRVVRCWPLATLDRARHVAFIEFQRRGSDALASLVLVESGRAIFADYPAEYRGPGEDLWRADDGGVLSPDGLDVVFVLQQDESYVLAIAWSAAEGRSLSLWMSQDDDRFVAVVRDYWYRPPQ